MCSNRELIEPILVTLKSSLDAILETVDNGAFTPKQILWIKKQMEIFLLDFHESMANHYLIASLDEIEIYG